MTNKWIMAGLGLAAGVLATIAVQSFVSTPPEAELHLDEEARGPHGGRLLASDLLTLEVTIFEEGVPPQYRVYPVASNGDAIRPEDVRLTATLSRLGGAVDRLTFTPESDYLRSNEVVEEPHSFSAEFAAMRGRRTATFAYEQIEGRTQIAEAALVSTGIGIATAAPGALTPVIELPGEVAVPPDRQVTVTARAPGVVTDLRVTVGQRVTRGDVLATISSRELAAAATAHAVAIARLEFARTTRDREADLVARRVTARQDLQLAEQAYAVAQAEVAEAREALLGLGLTAEVIAARPADPASLSRMPVSAPATGVVTTQMTTTGATLAVGDPLLTITDTREVWVNVQVHARDLDAVQRGRRVTVRSVGAATSAEGTIAAVSPLVGDDTRTATARVVLPNTDGRWHPGLFVTALVSLDTSNVPVVVPVDALQTFRDWTVVFVRYGDTFEARPVEIGRSDGRMTEIVSGLRPGERYAATNAFAVKADVLKSGASHDH